MKKIIIIVAILLVGITSVVAVVLSDKDDAGTGTEIKNEIITSTEKTSDLGKTTEGTTVAPQYTEKDVKEYFDWLTKNYNGSMSAQVLFMDDEDFKNIYLEWFMPREETYQFYNAEVTYNSTLKNFGGEDSSLKISDIMSESEFALIPDSGNSPFDVFKVEDIQKNIDRIWEKGRFDAESLDDKDFETRYITSKGYLVLQLDATDDYGTYISKYINYTQEGNLYTVKCYMMEKTGYDYYSVFDASTNCLLGSDNSGYGNAEENFDAVLSGVNKTTKDLKPVYMIFEGTDDGLRLKDIKLYRTEPDVTGNFGFANIKATGGLNMRTSPSTDSLVITLIPEGEQVYIGGKSETTDEWVYVYYDFFAGWVNKKYLVN